MPPRTTSPKPTPAPAARMPLANRPELCITRAANGWVIFDAAQRVSSAVGPLLVAESPARLAEIISAWAEG